MRGAVLARALVRHTIMGGMITRRHVVQAALSLPALAQTPSANGIPTRKLGNTGQSVSILGLGGAHLARAASKDANEGLRMAHYAIDNGVTFFDNAWEYFNGEAEVFMGKALAGGHRQRVFLMTKNCERDYAGAKKCLEDSLRRLQTDHIDLWQFHECNYDNDAEYVVEKGGLRAALEAVKEGKVRFLGFTGHKDPRIHLKMLAVHPWASAQMPINVMDAHYRSFQNEVVPVCVKKGVGVIGMKNLGGGPVTGRIPERTKITAEQCVRFGLSLPVSTLCRGYTSLEQLKQDVAIARDFKPLTLEQKKEILALSRPEATDGRHEIFKSTQFYDSGHHRAQHGFDRS